MSVRRFDLQSPVLAKSTEVLVLRFIDILSCLEPEHLPILVGLSVDEKWAISEASSAMPPWRFDGAHLAFSLWSLRAELVAQVIFLIVSRGAY